MGWHCLLTVHYKCPEHTQPLPRKIKVINKQIKRNISCQTPLKEPRSFVQAHCCPSYHTIPSVQLLNSAGISPMTFLISIFNWCTLPASSSFPGQCLDAESWLGSPRQQLSLRLESGRAVQGTLLWIADWLGGRSLRNSSWGGSSKERLLQLEQNKVQGPEDSSCLDFRDIKLLLHLHMQHSCAGLIKMCVITVNPPWSPSVDRTGAAW